LKEKLLGKCFDADFIKRRMKESFLYLVEKKKLEDIMNEINNL
jgi:hypothetical protein